MEKQIDIPKGWFPTPNSLVDDNKLNPNERITYENLLRHRGTGTKAFPSQDTLAREGNMSVSSVKRALNGLRDKGLVYPERQQRYGGGNDYYLIDYDRWLEDSDKGGHS